MEVEAVNMKNSNKEKRASKEGFTNFFNSKGFYIILILSIIIIGGATILITRQSLSSISDNEDLMPDDFEEYLVDYEDDFDQNDLVENDLVENEGDDIETSDDVPDSTSGTIGQLVDNQADIQVTQDKEVTGEKEASKDSEDDYLQPSDNTVAVGGGKSTDENLQQADSVAVGSESQAVKIPDIKEQDKEKDDRKENNDENQKTDAKEETSINEGKAEEKADEDQQAAEDDRDTEEVDFIMPVYGPIIYDYSMDKLAYSVTLNDWRTHKGLDIAAARGTAVKAVAAGVVIDVYEDPKQGFTVVIDHENGFKTVYSNLASGDIVVPNQIVEQGETIGAVGDTALYEIALEPHLHFEVIKDDKVVDPKLYLPSY